MGRWTIPRATQGTRSIRRGSVSSPTPRCASVARRARWRARNGTGCPTTGSTSSGCRSTTRACWARKVAARRVHRAAVERTGGDGRVGDQTDRTRWRRVGHDARRNGHPEVRAPPGRRHRRRVPNRLPVADELRYVQAPHAREVSGRVPDGRVVPHRVRHCRCAARHLQWMRLLRVGLPVWGDRPRRG